MIFRAQLANKKIFDKLEKSYKTVGLVSFAAVTIMLAATL